MRVEERGFGVEGNGWGLKQLENEYRGGKQNIFEAVYLRKMACRKSKVERNMQIRNMSHDKHVAIAIVFFQVFFLY